MCLVIIAHCMHPRYKNIIAANRDEFLDRPTQTTHRWQKNPAIIGGRDLVADGSWFATHSSGRWAAVTNYRDFKTSRPGKKSRGSIVRNWVDKLPPVVQFLDTLRASKNDYQGYNVLLYDGVDLYHYSNISDEVTKVREGIFAVANDLFDTNWPKSVKAKQELQQLLSTGEFTPDATFKLLHNSETAPVEQLPETGLPQEVEEKLSAVYVRPFEVKEENGEPRKYGTRNSTLLVQTYENLFSIFERNY